MRIQGFPNTDYDPTILYLPSQFGDYVDRNCMLFQHCHILIERSYCQKGYEDQM